MSLIAELQRRNVIRVGTAYVAFAWLVVQVLDSLAPVFGLSDAVTGLVVIVLAIGLVPVLVPVAVRADAGRPRPRQHGRS
ncbi:MAG: hypothetical protein OES78_11585 [Chromatiales bacterium]|jgi:hypothetical protein|nr:hypothetical protein [Chromatiales bacterium]MDH3895189.1 hypothetical protein [Chromatiales bacterium]MDH3931108.1 hypothetical protein [Chromatiales bacterium]MDH3945741.1 hypothetical protein [Chromatiales bacterium]MDH4014791.1 hypothetical protein [Chromatiales bacterium]